MRAPAVLARALAGLGDDMTAFVDAAPWWFVPFIIILIVSCAGAFTAVTVRTIQANVEAAL